MSSYVQNTLDTDCAISWSIMADSSFYRYYSLKYLFKEVTKKNTM